MWRGAYWLGDASRPMLQRIYGLAFKNRDDLKAHLHMLEEAAKRDHRKLGREMGLFHMQEEAPGQVFWHPNGWTIYTTLQDYMRRRQRADGYVEVNTPQVVNRKLWEASGHWENYREKMFIVEVDEDGAREKVINALKPMNCPCHVQIFNVGIKSYRDLPLRMAEFGSCARYEPSGALHGIMRVRGFTQDDAHIFCTLGSGGSGIEEVHRVPVPHLCRAWLRQVADQAVDAARKAGGVGRDLGPDGGGAGQCHHGGRLFV